MKYIDQHEQSRTAEQFMQERWPGADVDLFVYGLNEAQAQLKAIEILTKALASSPAYIYIQLTD